MKMDRMKSLNHLRKDWNNLLVIGELVHLPPVPQALHLLACPFPSYCHGDKLAHGHLQRSLGVNEY